ncbi:MAG: PHP domain-containing protein [Actinomycetota bacterium]|nr:MAG: PHP domain-containing protein [Actinomycetota bacterium]
MIDLHTHSRFSDGSDSPQGIVELAKAAGCSHIALTDHDRLDGIGFAKQRADELGIGFISGVEISCIFQVGTFHLLVYFLEPVPGPLQDRLNDIQQARTDRNLALARKLRDAGFPITWDELIEEAGGPNLGRPHFAAVMLKKGIVSSIQEAFDKYLAKGQPFYVAKVLLGPKEAIELALASRALPVIAHPLSLDLHGSELPLYISELKGYGLAGIESYYGRYSPEQRSFLVELAASLSLVATGGSDYHGTYKSGLHIGIGEGDLLVPDSVLDELRNRLA